MIMGSMSALRCAGTSTSLVYEFGAFQLHLSLQVLSNSLSEVLLHSGFISDVDHFIAIPPVVFIN